MIKEELTRILQKHFGMKDVPINVPPRPEMGDFSSAVCLSLAKERRRPPLEIAREEVGPLKKELPPWVEDVSVTPPGYLNFRIDWPGLARDRLPQIVDQGPFFGRPESNGQEKVFIEHTSVNPNKAMHIGHLRNAVLGDTVARVLKWLGYSTEVCNYIDDTGVQVVDVVTAFFYLDPPFYEEGQNDFGSIWSKVTPGERFDYYCWDLYTRFQTELERNPSLLEKKEEVLHEIEGGMGPVARFAKELATRIVRAHLETVAELSIFYDLLNWESDIIQRGFWQATFELLKERGCLRLESDGPNKGCWVVPFGGIVETDEGVKSLDKILVRSNGSVTYTGKDVAYQLWKFGLLKKDFLYKPWGLQANGETLWTTDREGDPPERLSRRFGHADRVINVIDTRQSYPQEIVVECLRKMGFEREADRSFHLAYEVVNLSAQAARALGLEAEGEKKAVAMSGRLGTGVKAKDFIEIVKKKIVEKADHKLDPWVCAALASAAIRYYLLRFTVESQILFDFDEALKTTGDTGIYLEYAHARACSILRKAEERKAKLEWDPSSVPSHLTRTERHLLNVLLDYPSAVARAGRNLRVSMLTEYAYQLATAFTDFYEHPDPDADVQTPFIHLEDVGLRTFRLALVEAFQRVMSGVLNLLGMERLERI